MTKLGELELAVKTLSGPELDAFRRWFEQFDAERFDAKIAEDAAAGRLDRLAEEALRDFAAGRTRLL